MRRERAVPMEIPMTLSAIPASDYSAKKCTLQSTFAVIIFGEK
jgi:hypothetical protein